MKTIAKILLPIIIMSAGGFSSCSNKPKIGEVPNLGVVEVPFTKDGKEILGQVMDVDNDLEIDGVLGDGYLLMYKEGYQNHPDFKPHYDSAKSIPLNKNGVGKLSDKLKKNNRDRYEWSLIEDYVQSGGI